LHSCTVLKIISVIAGTQAILVPHWPQAIIPPLSRGEKPTELRSASRQAHE
jgi:hypothetical protein